MQCAVQLTSTTLMMKLVRSLLTGSSVLILTVQSGAMSTAWRRIWEGQCVGFVVAFSTDVPLCIIQFVIFDVDGSIFSSFLMYSFQFMILSKFMTCT